MKRLLSAFILIFFLAQFSAQLDREHWFAPMFDRARTGGTYQSIYLSTNESTPFTVQIFNNNIQIGTVTIAKGAPVKYAITNRTQIISVNSRDLFKPVPMGIYLKGDKPFFASLRFSITNHGEIQTSKGSAALGTEFRAVMAPISLTNPILNFMTSMIATEDNTTIKVTEFSPTVRFTDAVARTEININLKKGESYIIEGMGDIAQNARGFIGAKIVSDKPIVIANGNFNGQYAGNYPNASDILMDQGVPIDKLGQDFVLMKGNGDASFGMERALILATEDGTEVYLNNSPVAVATLNAGQLYETNTSAYINQGSGNYNMYIRTTKNTYVYQLLAGANNSTGTQEATGGMNYIPPLSCYLPKKIDEIGKIEENEYSSNSVGYSLQVPTKLNIITETGADIKVFRNGAPLALSSINGPYIVTGNTGWVTYSIPNITGNISVESDKAVTAGISAGNDSVGYGGYFAGFSFIPAVIKREGECLPDVKLEITAGFDSYQWLMKVGSNYVPAPGINNTNIYQPTQAGIYAVKIKQGTCPEIQTIDYKFYNCTTYTNYTYDVCDVLIITPSFTLSPQSINNASIVIDTPPTKGTVTIAADGTLVYKPTKGAKGTDTFKYTFCGTGAIPDCETAQATININQVVAKDDIYSQCSTASTTNFDLTKANVTDDTNIVSAIYYNTKLGAENQTSSDEISTFTSFPAADNTIVFVRLTNDKGCFAIQQITLKIISAADVKPELYTVKHCDEADTILDNKYLVDVTTITPYIVASTSGFVIKYYDTAAKANIGGTDNITGNFSFTQSTNSVWVRVDSNSGCPTVIKEVTLNIGSKIPLITTKLSKNICDSSLDNTEDVDLSQYLSEFSAETPPLTTSYFKTLDDAMNHPENAILATQSIGPGKTTFYYRILSAKYCAEVVSIEFDLLKGTASSTLPTTPVTICEDTTYTFDAGPGFSSYEWFNENNTSLAIGTSPTITVSPGRYFVILKTLTGSCPYTQSVELIGYPKPVLNVSAFNPTLCDDDLDGKINVKFSSQVTPNILQNSNLYTITYYDDAGFSNILSDDWSYTADTKVWVKVTSPYCADTTGFIDFKIGSKVALTTVSDTTTICDDDLDGKVTIPDLSIYRNLFTNDATLQVSYHNTKLGAQNNNDIISGAIDVQNSKVIYLRISGGGLCPILAELTIKVNIPTASTTLQDEQICKNTTTTLDAGPGFLSYEWYNESDLTTILSTSQTYDAPIGNFVVVLEAQNSCKYSQKVKVTEVDPAKITAIMIEGTTVTIKAAGGKPPYIYALDYGAFGPSNIFTDVQPGNHVALVQTASNCIPTEMPFTIIKILNTITPNADGKNDVIDYSVLKTKTDAKLIIIDRYGKKVYDAADKKEYIWDGKLNGKPLPSDTYWYIMEWKEFGVETPSQQKGWILLKNN